MTSRDPAQCLTCRHFRSPLDGAPERTCAAFPKGIPYDIWWNQADHRKPAKGDNGVRWESFDGAEFPEWAMAGATGLGRALSARWPRLLNVAATQINLDQVQADFDAHLDRLLATWFTVTAKQRREIYEQVRAAIERSNLAGLAKMSVTVEEAQDNLLAAMDDMAMAAAQRMVDEAAEQSVNIEPHTGDRRLRDNLAGAVVLLLGQGLTNSAGREALRLYRRGVSGAEVAQAVDEHLGELGDTFLRDNLGGALSGAQNDARLDTMLAGPEAAVYASEWMDKNSCRPCREINGKFLGLTSQPDIIERTHAAYPSGGYVGCLGGVRCRGTVVSIYRPETVAEEEVLP